MKAYSDDLRQCVAAACAVPGWSLPQVAAQFAFRSFSSRSSGSASAPIAPLPPYLTAAVLRCASLKAGRATLLTCVAAQSDATLDELRQYLVVAGGPKLGRTALWSALQEQKAAYRAQLEEAAQPCGVRCKR